MERQEDDRPRPAELHDRGQQVIPVADIEEAQAIALQFALEKRQEADGKLVRLIWQGARNGGHTSCSIHGLFPRGQWTASNAFVGAVMVLLANFKRQPNAPGA